MKALIKKFEKAEKDNNEKEMENKIVNKLFENYQSVNDDEKSKKIKIGNFSITIKKSNNRLIEDNEIVIENFNNLFCYALPFIRETYSDSEKIIYFTKLIEILNKIDEVRDEKSKMLCFDYDLNYFSLSFKKAIIGNICHNV